MENCIQDANKSLANLSASAMSAISEEKQLSTMSSEAHNVNDDGSSCASVQETPPETKAKADIRPHPNIYIRNLPPSFTVRDLSEFYAIYGEVRSLHILTDPNTKKSKCVGFVRFATSRDAIAAIAGTNGRIVTGSHRPLVVRFADRKPRPAKGEKNYLPMHIGDDSDTKTCGPQESFPCANPTFYPYNYGGPQQHPHVSHTSIFPSHGSSMSSGGERWQLDAPEGASPCTPDMLADDLSSLSLVTPPTASDGGMSFAYAPQPFSAPAPFATVVDHRAHAQGRTYTVGGMVFPQHHMQLPMSPSLSLSMGSPSPMPSSTLSSPPMVSPALSYPSSAASAPTLSASPSISSTVCDSSGLPSARPSRSSFGSHSSHGMRDSTALCPVRIHVPKPQQRHPELMPRPTSIATVGHVRPTPPAPCYYPAAGLEPVNNSHTFPPMPDSYAHVREQQGFQQRPHHYAEHQDSAMSFHASQAGGLMHSHRTHAHAPQGLNSHVFGRPGEHGPSLHALSLSLVQPHSAGPARADERPPLSGALSLDAGDAPLYTSSGASPTVNGPAQAPRRCSQGQDFVPAPVSLASFGPYPDVAVPWRATLALRDLPGHVSLAAVHSITRGFAALHFHVPARSRLFEKLCTATPLAQGATVPLLLVEFHGHADAEGAGHVLRRTFPQATVSLVSPHTELDALLTLPAVVLESGEPLRYFEVLPSRGQVRECHIPARDDLSDFDSVHSL